MVTWKVPALVIALCGLVFAGCGTDADSQAADPDVRSRVIATNSLLGFPLLREAGNSVRTDPAVWIEDSPFPLYLDPEKAAADLRAGGFVAGIMKIFKAREGVGSAGNIVVQMSDEKGASAEVERQVAQAVALPCPDACTKHITRFAVPDVPGARGIDLTSRFNHRVTEGGKTFNVTHDITIVFTKDAFAYQLFAGGPGMEMKRDALVAAAQAQYKRVP